MAVHSKSIGAYLLPGTSLRVREIAYNLSDNSWVILQRIVSHHSKSMIERPQQPKKHLPNV